MLFDEVTHFVNNVFSTTRSSNTELRVLENLLEIFVVTFQGVFASNLGEDFAESDWTDLAIWFGECNESAGVDAIHDFFTNGAVDEILNHFGESVGTIIVSTNSIVEEFFGPASITRRSTTTGFLEGLLERKSINLETGEITFGDGVVGASSTIFAFRWKIEDGRFTSRVETLKFLSICVIISTEFESIAL